jgi:CRP-like cAMP-binding protein
VLFRQGELPARVHVVRHGSVELSRRVGGRRAVLQILREGDVFGDVPLLVRMPEPFDARALEDSVVLSADSVELFRLLERRPRLARRWLVSVAMRMAATQARLVDLLAGGLEAQVASLLARQAEEGVVRLNQTTLADLLGARRPSVNRVLKRLEAEGLIRVGYRQVEILDAAGLLAFDGTGHPPGAAAAAAS